MGWLWIGIAIGLLVGAGAVAVVLRAVGRLTGADRRSLGRLVLDGLVPGGRRNGVDAQRALARRLKRAGQRTASGRRVAAAELTVHVSPEDLDAIEHALGVETAEGDLAEFYRAHAARGNWLVSEDPEVHLVRDISLRPRQAFVRATTRAAPGSRPAVLRDSHGVAAPPPRVPDDAAVTDVLPRAIDEDTAVTAVYPAGLLIGDLVVVHGTDVRTVAPDQGELRIGRGRQNDLVLDRPGIARDHLVIQARDEAWWIVPGAGTTKLDGVALDGPAPVGAGGTLELGRGVRIRVSVGPV